MPATDFVEEQGASIVANGSFNPAIFHPAWFAKHGLLTPEEEEAAKIGITHAEVSNFQVPGLRFDIQTERALIQSATEPLIRAADIFSRMFGELLPHTPIEAVGINYWTHFSLNSWKQRQAFGRLLAPLDAWGAFGDLMESKDKELAGGFSTLAFKAYLPENGSLGALNVTIQPSTRVGTDSGVFMNVNHHFADDKEEFNFPDLIGKQFDNCVRRSRDIIFHMIEKGRTS